MTMPGYLKCLTCGNEREERLLNCPTCAHLRGERRMPGGNPQSAPLGPHGWIPPLCSGQPFFAASGSGSSAKPDGTADLLIIGEVAQLRARVAELEAKDRDWARLDAVSDEMAMMREDLRRKREECDEAQQRANRLADVCQQLADVNREIAARLGQATMREDRLRRELGRKK